MIEFLKDFEKRMEWIGVVESIVNRKGKNTQLESLFKENDLSNIIFALLLFIMERTLTEDDRCDIKAIQNFLKDLLETYYLINLDEIEIKNLSSYLVKDILQNNGESYIYKAKNYSDNSYKEINIRLINDKVIENKNESKIIYRLSNQGYDFIFRTKEVDEELKFSIEQFKLKEYIKRKRFNSAVRQSLELITFVKQEKKKIEEFILNVKENITKVNSDEYSALVERTYFVLEEEKETMDDILKMVRQAEGKMNEELGSEIIEQEDFLKAKKEIEEVIRNIDTVIVEQRNLINSRQNLGNIYLETLKKSLDYSFEKRYDFEEKVLKELENYNNSFEKIIKLLNPLFLPKFPKKWLNIKGIYENQFIFRDREESKEEIIDYSEMDIELEEELRIEKINEKYREITIEIFEEAYNNKTITLKELIEIFKNKGLYNKFVENRDLFIIAIKLYDIGEIKLKEFYNEKKTILSFETEEYDLELILTNKVFMDRKFVDNINGLFITKEVDQVKEKFEIDRNGIKFIETIEFTNLRFEVN